MTRSAAPGGLRLRLVGLGRRIGAALAVASTTAGAPSVPKK